MNTAVRARSRHGSGSWLASQYRPTEHGHEDRDADGTDQCLSELKMSPMSPPRFMHRSGSRGSVAATEAHLEAPENHVLPETARGGPPKRARPVTSCQQGVTVEAITRRGDLSAGQLASMFVEGASAVDLRPTTHSTMSLQNVPAPTAPGIRSEPSKRNTSELDEERGELLLERVGDQRDVGLLVRGEPVAQLQTLVGVVGAGEVLGDCGDLGLVG